MPYTSKDKARENHRAYYRRHREEILAAQKDPAKREQRLAKQRERSRRYYQRHREEILKDKKEHPEAARRQEAEAGRSRPSHCDICAGKSKRIEFDHCHQRGIFRGWLCTPCNTILGLVHDDPNRLRMLIAYLERTKDLVPPQMSLPGI